MRLIITKLIIIRWAELISQFTSMVYRNLNIQDTLNKYSSGYSLGAKLLSEDFSELIMKK